MTFCDKYLCQCSNFATPIQKKSKLELYRGTHSPKKSAWNLDQKNEKRQLDIDFLKEKKIIHISRFLKLRVKIQVIDIPLIISLNLAKKVVLYTSCNSEEDQVKENKNVTVSRDIFPNASLPFRSSCFIFFPIQFKFFTSDLFNPPSL